MGLGFGLGLGFGFGLDGCLGTCAVGLRNASSSVAVMGRGFWLRVRASHAHAKGAPGEVEG